MKKTLVTGATGFVGSVLVRQLVEAGTSVRILRRTTSKLDLLGDMTHQVEHAIGDVTDPESVYAAMQDVGQVYHTAGYVAFRGKRDWGKLKAVNVAGTANIVNAALEAGVERMVHTSSIAAIGRPEPPPAMIDETLQWQTSKANALYGVSKYQAELEVHRGIAEGLDAVLVNPASIWGVGRHGENTRDIVDKIRFRKLPAMPAGGTNVVDVEDVAAGHILAMQKGKTGERYILGSENLTWVEIMTMLAEGFGVAPPSRVLSPRLGLVMGFVFEALAGLTGIKPVVTRETVRIAAGTYRYSNQKAIEELGCSFRPFHETVTRIVQGVQ